MADEIIGDLGIEITGDFSELQSAIDGAVAEATAGAGKIADAFSAPAGAEAMAQAFTDVGDAAQSGAQQVSDFTPAAQAAGDSAEQAESGIQGMAEQFAALAEALVVTEGLKEFGQEALQAFGTVQSVTIGLTQLTGSAEKADAIIEQIKTLAATEPFAFPEIAPTVQKMVALGVSAEAIPGVMQHVADAAAATGNSFQQVANSFDRMTLSGTAGARQLVQLGVSAQQLGEAMGVTASQVAVAFKALDQSQRIQVLEDAMTKFAGAAEAQAQGIAGQWQIFQNQFEEVMVGVGNALAPVVGDILAFGKTVLTAIQEAVDAFNKLPEPVKDVAVALGLVVAAIAPLAAAVSAVGFAIIGFNAAWSTGASILEAFSGSAASAVEANVALAESSAAATIAEEGQTVATGELATAEKGLGAASAGAAEGMGLLAAGVATAAGAFAGWSLGKWIADNIPQLSKALAEAGVIALALATNNIPALIAILNDLQPPLIQVGQGFETVSGSMSDGGAHVTDVTSKLSQLIQPLTDVTKKQTDANAAFGQAQVAYQLAKVALDNAIPGTQQYALALQVVQRAAVALDTAQQSMTAHGKDWADTIGGITQKMGEAQEKFQSLVAVFGQLNEAQNGSAQSAALTAQAYTQLESAAKSSGNAFADYRGILAQVDVTVKQNYANFQQLGAAYGTLLSLQQTGVDVTAQLADVYGKWQTAAKSVGESISTSAGVMATLTQNAKAQTDALQSTAGAFIKLAAIQQPTEQQQIALGAAFKTIVTDADAMGISVTQAGDSLVFAAKAGTTASPALQTFINTMNNQFASAKNLISVNGNLTATIAALFGAYNQAAQAAQKAADATKNAQAATIGHTQSMSDQIQALQAQANQLNVTVDAATRAATAMSNVTIAVKGFQISGNAAVQNLQNMLDAFNQLNSTTATTADQQIALQDSFKALQAAASAAGLQVQYVGNQVVFTTNAATKGIPALQNLATALNQDASAAAGATNNLNAVGAAATKTGQDLGALTGIAKEVSDALDKIGEGGQGGGGTWNVLPGSQISSGEPSATGSPFGSQTGIVPIPRDPNPGSDYWNPAAGAWVSIPPGYQSINQTTSPGAGYTPLPPPPPTNNPSPFPTTGAAGGLTAFSDAVGAATSAVQGMTSATADGTTAVSGLPDPLNSLTSAASNVGKQMGNVATAASSVANPLGDFNTGLINVTTTTGDAAKAMEDQALASLGLPSIEQDQAAATAALTSATQDASEAMVNVAQSTATYATNLQGIDLIGAGTNQQDEWNALGASQQKYNNILAQAIDAQGALTNELNKDAAAGVKVDASLVGLQEAANAANAALASSTGEFSTPLDGGSTPVLPTDITPDQILGITPTDQATSDRNTYSSAQDALIAAIKSGTATQDQISQLQSAAASAQATYNNDYATAQADAINAQNAYTNALLSGTATQEQLNSLSAAAFAAQQKANNAPNLQGAALVGTIGPNGQIEPTNYSPIGPEGPTQLSPGGYTPPTAGATPNYQAPLTINLSFGTVVGSNAAQQLTNIVAPGIVAQLRQAGLKIG